MLRELAASRADVEHLYLRIAEHGQLAADIGVDALALAATQRIGKAAFLVAAQGRFFCPLAEYLIGFKLTTNGAGHALAWALSSGRRKLVRRPVIPPTLRLKCMRPSSGTPSTDEMPRSIIATRVSIARRTRWNTITFMALLSRWLRSSPQATTQSQSGATR